MQIICYMNYISIRLYDYLYTKIFIEALRRKWKNTVKMSMSSAYQHPSKGILCGPPREYGGDLCTRTDKEQTPKHNC